MIHNQYINALNKYQPLLKIYNQLAIVLYLYLKYNLNHYSHLKKKLSHLLQDYNGRS